MNHLTWESFKDFAEEVKNSARYIYSDKAQNLLSEIKDSLPNRAIRIPKGTVLFRSQLGFAQNYLEDFIDITTHPMERMKPVSGVVTEGRANSKNIPVLYLSSDANTSMAELRPQVGQVISCGQFETNRMLKLVDCYSSKNEYTRAQLIFGSPKPEDDGWLDGIWFQVNEAFSQPVVNEPSNAAYVPTQILSELFRHSGYDGLVCKSHLGEGKNYILFQLTDADMKNSELMTTKQVNYNFETFDKSRWGLDQSA